ncbi:MAG TPA: sialate O-acetylesterase [Acidobacteriaceae bacterium]|nr:sialate O-acetylesterase [Acidobacteriaceae bacterium]
MNRHRTNPFASFTLLACVLLLCSVFAHAQASAPVATTRLPHMLSDHAVLQRDRPIHIWGWDAPGAAVTVDFRRQHASTHADDLGAWSVYLNPEKAGGPDTLTIHGSTQITLSDILVGDVWFASGQSNMQIPLRGFPGSAVIKDADKEIASANDPSVCGQIHLLVVPIKSNDFPLDDQPSSWTPCNSTTATEFSAVAFFFGREIHAREHIPIGLIDSTWGGTPISSWISLSALASDSNRMPVFAARARFADLQPHLAAQQAYEQRTIAAAEAANQPVPRYPWINPDESSWEPAFLFNGMIAPATPYTIRGFLWYQGETDSNPELFTPQLYNRLLPTLIHDWRARWNEGDLPFLYAQISNFNSPLEDWGTIRDAERQTLAVTNTAMAVTLDVGAQDNVHPPDKQTVATRLALGARDLVYGEHVEDSGPLPISVTTEGDALRVWFSHADGLHATSSTLHGFEVADADGRFHTADATIEGTTVVVRSANISHPTRIRYAWSSFTDANLANGAGLPASTFALP